MQPEFPRTKLNQVRRIPNRGFYDHATVFSVIDAAPFAHIAIPASELLPTGIPSADESNPESNYNTTIIPMLHARRGTQILFHGAQTSRMMGYLASGQPVTASFALADGLVLAKSLFHHSMNYRSALIFGRGAELLDDRERMDALRCFSEKLLPGRWDEARQPNSQELKATKIVAVEIETASAKIRTGGPKEDADDESLPIWSGVIPWSTVWGEPEVDPLSKNRPLPESVKHAKG